MSEIGSFLKKIRQEKGLSFREAGELSGLSHSYIRYLEIGKRPGTDTPINPTPETLKALSKAYECDYEELMRTAGYITDKPDGQADNEDINTAFHDFDNITEEEKEYLEAQLEIFRKIKEGTKTKNNRGK